MTIDEGIKRLERAKERFGGETPLYFDCPDCGKAYTPDILAAERRVHVPCRKDEPRPDGA